MKLITSLVMTLALVTPALAKKIAMKPIATQYVAALGDKTAKSGTGAESWGLWPVDPGPRGVRLYSFPNLASTHQAPAGWKFDDNSWWLEEHGLIMEAPQFPVPAGRYVVTGGRTYTAILTVKEKDASGKQAWELSDDVMLYDVTHLGCRAANYTPEKTGEVCTPNHVYPEQFPMYPGKQMPETPNCSKQEYQVLIVIGMAEES